MPSTAPYVIVIFIATIALVLTKPRGYHEAWWTLLGAALMLGFGLVAVPDLITIARAGKHAMLFLLALLLLSVFLEKSGFFEWAAIVAGRYARGQRGRLFRNVFILGALITATLSLDTTAVILTPIVLALVRRVRVNAVPYVVACAFVANVGSLLLPVSNLTNIIFADAFQLSFSAFVARMALPQLSALLALFLLLRRHFKLDLHGEFELSSLPAASSVIPHRGYFRAAVAILFAVLVGYFVAPLFGIASYVVGFAGAMLLAVFGIAFKRVRPATLKEVSWGVFPFVAGLFIVVQGVENIGVASAATRFLSVFAPGSLSRIAATTGFAALASNLMNNLPAALIARSALLPMHADPATQYAALLGTDLGPNVLPFGSLATMLVLTSARSLGTPLRARALILPGLWITPIVLVVSVLALAGTLLVAR